MKKFLVLVFLLPIICFGQEENKINFGEEVKKIFKFSTFYCAVNGSNSVSDVDVFSVTNGLETQTIETPFDYSIKLGVRKIAWFGYENKARAFYNGTENSFSDAATMGRKNGLEYLSEVDWRRQQGQTFFNQNHFVRYVADKYIIKFEYLEDGFADIKFFEMSERYRYKLGKKLSFNIGAVQRLSEPYGYDPLEEWMLSNGNLHYTYLAIQEGYTMEFDGMGGVQYFDPSGNLVAENTQVWEAVAIPQALSDYTEKKRDALENTLQHSIVIGFDYYHYTKTFWLHGWGNLMPYHYDDGGEFSYHEYNDGQWLDYSGGLIFGYKFNKNLGIFAEGKYNKYWNRNWHAFSVGVNYRVF